MNGGDFDWTFQESDDTNYSVDTALKAKVVNYKSSVLAIGGYKGVDVEPSTTEKQLKAQQRQLKARQRLRKLQPKQPKARQRLRKPQQRQLKVQQKPQQKLRQQHRQKQLQRYIISQRTEQAVISIRFPVNFLPIREQ